jgi:dimethylargininase
MPHLNLKTAFVRSPPKAYPSLYSPKGIDIDYTKALVQHADYVATLRACGLEVRTIRTDESLADCVFVEDPAVIWNGHALIGRLGPGRTGEESDVEIELLKSFNVSYLPHEANLEGGDVIHTGGRTFVGLSSRTNEVGAAALGRFLYAFGVETVPVPVRNCLHLETGATYIGDNTIVICPDLIDPAPFAAFNLIEIPKNEANAANCLRISSTVLAPKGYPESEERLRQFTKANDCELVVLDISEFEKGDGSMTCLSLLA